MRRIVLVVGMIALAGAAFAAGNVVPKLKFPWASEALNKPCDKTELEWRCLANAIPAQAKPAKLTRAYDMVELQAKPAKEGLLLKIVVAPRPPFAAAPGTDKWRGEMDAISRIAGEHAKRRLVDKDTCEDLRDMYLELHYGDKLIGTRNIDGFKFVAER